MNAERAGRSGWSDPPSLIRLTGTGCLMTQAPPSVGVTVAGW